MQSPLHGGAKSRCMIGFDRQRRETFRPLKAGGRHACACIAKGRRVHLGRKLVVLLSVGVLVLAACSDDGGADNAGEGSGEKQYEIGGFASLIFDQVQEMLVGFKGAMNNCGLVEGDNTTYFINFAQGDEGTLQLIGRQYVQDQKVDLLLSMDTPSLVTAANLTEEIPIIEVAATYPVASGVVESLEEPGTNVTGGTDFIPLDLALDTVLRGLPDLKTVGMITNPSEENSAQFQQEVRPELEDRGIELKEVTVVNTGEVQTAVRGLVREVDAILLGPDNTALAAAGNIVQVATGEGVPVVSYVAGVASQGALFDLGVDYEVLGFQAGEKACDILLEGADPATIPITSVPEPIISYNPDVANDLGIELPQEFLDGAVEASAE